MSNKLNEDASMIIQDYKLAKDPEEQIEIMAQTHATSTAEIRKLLFENGVYKINGEHIAKALEILQKGGKNHGIANLRSWISAFGQCNASQAKKVLLDYRACPWDGRPEAAIPDEEFAKAFGENRKEDRKNAVKVYGQGFGAKENSIIVSALKALLEERTSRLDFATNDATEKRHKYESAKQAYDEAMKRMDAAAEELQEVKKLLERIGG